MSTLPEPVPLEETPDLYGAYPRLSPEQVERLAQFGARRETQAGDVLYREGETDCEFIVILEGKVAIVEAFGTPAERVVSVHGPRRFIGEFGLLIGQPVFLSAVVREPGAVLCVPTDHLRTLVGEDEALGDIILRALLLRRSILIGLGTGFRIIGSRYAPDTRRLREFAARNRLPHRWIDLEEDEGAERLLRTLGVEPEETPVVILRGTEVLRNPSNEELARRLGLLETSEVSSCDLLVVGGGPAGLAASVYGASEGLSTVVLDGVALGGQAGTSSRIENYLGFPAGISGAELAERAEVQAEKFGARMLVPAEATAIAVRDGGYDVTYGDEGETIRATSVVVSCGVRYRKLPLARLEELEGVSVYYAATLMEAQICAGDPVVVVGGGNSAGQATLFLSEYVPTVHLVVREPTLDHGMSRYLTDRIERTPNVEVHTSTEVRELVGERALEAVVVENNQTGERDTLEAHAMFVFIGAEPHTDWLGDLVELDSGGYVKTGRDVSGSAGCDDAGDRAAHQPLLLETSQPGIFAAGDVRSGSIKRVAAAVGEGSMAVRLVHEHLAGRHHPDPASQAPAVAATS
ncbi:MAG TPA: FAD-dependent oxidoreductase [Solirubrobacteraceae bacterium]